MKKRAMKKSTSKKLFKATVDRKRQVNTAMPMRGGIRL